MMEDNIVKIILEGGNFDLIKEIFKQLDNESLTSILLINRHLCQFSALYRDNIFKYALQRELYYNERYPERSLKMRMRLNGGQHNYKVITINGDKAECIRVDLLGHRLNEDNYYLTYRPNNNYQDQFPWYHDHQKLWKGIILFDGGPIITKFDSQYLKYLVESKIPKIGTYVLLGYIKYYFIEYVVQEININTMILKHAKSYNCLYCEKITEKWKIIDGSSYEIIRFASN